MFPESSIMTQRENLWILDQLHIIIIIVLYLTAMTSPKVKGPCDLSYNSVVIETAIDTFQLDLRGTLGPDIRFRMSAGSLEV